MGSIRTIANKARVVASTITARTKRLSALLGVFALLACANISSAADAALLETGVNPSDYAGTLVTKLGTYAGVAMGAGLAIFALFWGFRALKASMGGGRK